MPDLNRELCQIRPGYVNELNTYRRVLRQRNAYLKEERIDEAVLEIWDEELIRSGARLVRERRKFIEKINEISRDIHHRISGGRELLQLDYESQIDQEGNEEELFLQLLQESKEKDRAYGTTRKGPHHDDISISADGVDLRKFGPQGQQRTAALSLKLSEILSDQFSGRQSDVYNDHRFDRICGERTSGGKSI